MPPEPGSTSSPVLALSPIDSRTGQPVGGGSADSSSTAWSTWVHAWNFFLPTEDEAPAILMLCRVIFCLYTRQRLYRPFVASWARMANLPSSFGPNEPPSFATAQALIASLPSHSTKLTHGDPSAVAIRGFAGGASGSGSGLG